MALPHARHCRSNSSLAIRFRQLPAIGTRTAGESDTGWLTERMLRRDGPGAIDRAILRQTFAPAGQEL